MVEKMQPQLTVEETEKERIQLWKEFEANKIFKEIMNRMVHLQKENASLKEWVGRVDSALKTNTSSGQQQQTSQTQANNQNQGNPNPSPQNPTQSQPPQTSKQIPQQTVRIFEVFRYDMENRTICDYCLGDVGNTANQIKLFFCDRGCVSEVQKAISKFLK